MPIKDFFNDSEIFITGGSGVVGKALIEKLLRTCNVRKIYLLLRPRKSLNAEQRLSKLWTAKIFNVLRQQKPDAIDKLVAIPGDVIESNMSITPAYAKLIANVTIVFHCAATVRFDEGLKDALILNVGGTYECLKFAEKLKKLDIFMHVSTFYSNPYLTYVEPKLYPSPMDWRLCLKMLSTIKDEQVLDALTKKMIVGFPNTYTFTKNLAESLVNDFRDRMRVIIYRPSIVLFALREPEPGFSPSLMGAMGLFTLVGTGILKTVYLGSDVRLDITPQDVGVKMMLYFATRAKDFYQKGTPDVVPVFLSSSSTYASHSFRRLAELMDEHQLWQKTAFEKNLMLPGCKYTDSRLLYILILFTKQILPALLFDFLIVLSGRKPVIMSIIRKGYTTLEVMQPFMFNNYESPGTTELPNMMKVYVNTEFDVSKDFESTHTDICMIDYCQRMLNSIRKDLLNEDPSTLPRARTIMKIKQTIYYCMHSYLTYKLLNWVFNKIF